MKKLVATMLTVLACGGAYALPVGNPADASLLCDGLFWEGNCCLDPCDPCASWCDAFSFRFGMYGDYVFNRHLEIGSSDDDDDSDTGPDIERARLFTNAGYIALNLWNRFDVFAALGTTRFAIDTNASAFSLANGPRLEITTRDWFSWSVGGRLTLWECGCTTLGLEGQYFQTDPRIERVTLAAAASVYPENLSSRYHEWQVGLGIAHRINMLVPYVAVKYSRAKWTFDANTSIADLIISLRDLHTRKHWGLAAGVTLVDCNKMSVTVEGRWFDEEAVHVNAQIRF